MVRIERALLSVSDKTGLIPFAQALAAAGVELLSTGGTARALRDAGLAVLDISAYTGFPEMLDGRVKTLHPKVHGGLLYIRGNAAHEAAARQHEIKPIDLVVVNLYPFEQTVARPDVSLHDAIENIDLAVLHEAYLRRQMRHILNLRWSSRGSAIGQRLYSRTENFCCLFAFAIKDFFCQSVPPF